MLQLTKEVFFCMKIKFILFTALFLPILLASCGEEKKTNTIKETNSIETTTIITSDYSSLNETTTTESKETKTGETPETTTNSSENTSSAEGETTTITNEDTTSTTDNTTGLEDKGEYGDDGEDWSTPHK